MPIRRVILDTDIGTDVDDACALALALRSPEIRLEAVTVVYGDVELRARIVRKLLAIAGPKYADVPVGKGVGQPLLGKRPVYWAGHEGQGILGPDEPPMPPDTPHAVDLIVSTVLDNPGEITLLSIGPLTNLATAVVREPTLSHRVKEVILMGGVVRLGDSLSFPWAEHNIRCDPEAAHIVFSAGWPITMVGLDVTLQVTIQREQLRRLSAVDSPLNRAVVDQLDRYMTNCGRNFTYLHDPLALAVAIDPSLVRLVPMHVDVETRGEFTSGATVACLPSKSDPRSEPNANVAVAVDVNRFLEFFFGRLSRPME